MKKEKESTQNPRGDIVNIVLRENGAFILGQALPQTLSHFILTKTLGGGYLYCSCGTSEESEAQRG